MKKKLVLIVLTAIAVISVVGVVSAQEQTPPPEPLGQTTQTPTASGTGTFLSQILQTVATDLDMQPQDIIQQLRSGQTLAQIIQSKNGDVTKITADLTTEITTLVNQAVSDGKLTQDRATQILNNLPTAIQNAINGTGSVSRLGLGLGQGQGQKGQRPGLRGVRPDILGQDARPLISAIESATKLTGQQIVQEMRSKNETLGQVITAHGGDDTSIINAAIATATQRLDKIRQKGTLTQDQETQILSGLQAFYTAVLNGAFHNAQPQAAAGAV